MLFNLRQEDTYRAWMDYHEVRMRLRNVLLTNLYFNTHHAKSIDSFLSLTAFVTAGVMTVMVHNYYNNMASMYANGNQGYYNYNNYDEQHSEDEEQEVYEMLASVGSTSVVFAGLYTGCLALALSVFGAMNVVGCMSFRGNFIPPQYTGTDNNVVSKKNLGIFMGAVVLFSNLCLVCAVVLGEFQVRFIASSYHLLH